MNRIPGSPPSHGPFQERFGSIVSKLSRAERADFGQWFTLGKCWHSSQCSHLVYWIGVYPHNQITFYISILLQDDSECILNCGSVIASFAHSKNRRIQVKKSFWTWISFVSYHSVQCYLGRGSDLSSRCFQTNETANWTANPCTQLLSLQNCKPTAHLPIEISRLFLSITHWWYLLSTFRVLSDIMILQTWTLIYLSETLKCWTI